HRAGRSCRTIVAGAGGPRTADARGVVRAQRAWRRRIRVDRSGLMSNKGGGAVRLASLALATLAFVFALFCAWQAWIMVGAGRADDEVRAARQQAVVRLGEALASRRAAIAKVLADPALRSS